MEDVKSNISFPIIILSLLVGFYVDVKGINWSLVYGYTSGGIGFMSILYPATTLFIVSVLFFTKVRKFVNFQFSSLWMLIYLGVFYIYTFYFIGSPRVTPSFFLIFTVVGFLIPNISVVDARIFVKSVMFWTFFAIFRVDRIFFMTLSWAEIISMDASYAFLPPIIANIVYLFTYYKNESKIQKAITIALSLINSIFFFQLFMYGSRGPLLAITLAISFFLVSKYDVCRQIVIFKYKRLSIAILLIILMFFLTANLADLVSYIFDFFGLKSHAFEKILRLASEGDLSNGRDDYANITIAGILDSPLLGHGMDRFEANTGLPYPHNFILQSLFDGGIVLFLVLVVPMHLRIIKIFKNCTYDQYVFYSLLFFASVPYALFSQDMWENALFWLFNGALYNKGFIYTKLK